MDCPQGLELVRVGSEFEPRHRGCRAQLATTTLEAAVRAALGREGGALSSGQGTPNPRTRWGQSASCLHPALRIPLGQGGQRGLDIFQSSR